MCRLKRLSQGSASAYIYFKTKIAEQNCQATALATAGFSYAKLDLGNQNQ